MVKGVEGVYLDLYASKSKTSTSDCDDISNGDTNEGVINYGKIFKMGARAYNPIKEVYFHVSTYPDNNTLTPMTVSPPQDYYHYIDLTKCTNISTDSSTSAYVDYNDGGSYLSLKLVFDNINFPQIVNYYGLGKMDVRLDIDWTSTNTAGGGGTLYYHAERFPVSLRDIPNSTMSGSFKSTYSATPPINGIAGSDWIESDHIPYGSFVNLRAIVNRLVDNKAPIQNVTFNFFVGDNNTPITRTFDQLHFPYDGRILKQFEDIFIHQEPFETGLVARITRERIPRLSMFSGDLDVKVRIITNKGMSDGSTRVWFKKITITGIPPPVSNICFVKDTLIQTDQGYFKIQQLRPYHTIRTQPIQAITKTVTHEKELVEFQKNALGKNIPFQTTVCSLNHQFYINNVMVPAKYLVNGTTIRKIPYKKEALYNVLLKEHALMAANGIITETLNPTSLTKKVNKPKKLIAFKKI